MSDSFAAGAAYIDGRYMPINQATIPVTDWAYRLSDATYDVVSVWRGFFFRLDDHIARFRQALRALRLAPIESDDDVRCVPHRRVQRGPRFAGKAYHPANCRNYIVAFGRLLRRS